MTTFQKIILGVIAIAVVVLGFHSFGNKTLGDATVSNYPTWYFNGIQIGPDSKIQTSPKNVIVGTCDITGTGSVANLATTSGSCVVVGAKVGDKVFMTQPTKGGTGAYPVTAASVTSAGVITAVLQNITGGAAAPSTGAITAVQYLVIR